VTNQAFSIRKPMALNKFIWAIIFIPLVVGLFHYKKLTRSHRFLYWFIVVGTLTELANKTLKEIFVMKNNMPLGHLYISISFIFLALFYLFELKSFINKKIIIAVIILYELFCLHNVIFFQSHLAFPSLPGAISSLLLVAFSVLLFAYIMREGEIQVLTDSSLIWINSAVLLYFAGNFFYYSLFNLMLNYSHEFLIRTFIFFSILNSIFYILIAIGLWKAAQRKQTIKN
jgi:hypothetical protein